MADIRRIVDLCKLYGLIKVTQELVINALADGIISESRAGEFLGMPVRDFMSKEAKTHGRWLTEVCN